MLGLSYLTFEWLLFGAEGALIGANLCFLFERSCFQSTIQRRARPSYLMSKTWHGASLRVSPWFTPTDRRPSRIATCQSQTRICPKKLEYSSSSACGSTPWIDFPAN